MAVASTSKLPDISNGLSNLSVLSGTNTERSELTASSVEEQAEATGPFEGPEKLLEIWFSDTPGEGRGLRSVAREDWEAMLDEVHCQVLSVINSHGVDAYLLSESSMFVWPHKLILKTCGTTTLLLGIDTILRLAKQAGFSRGVWRAFYSRKTFMFPDLQKGPHKDWKDEMAVLDGYFQNGSGYTVGPMNGDHWLLYTTTPNDEVLDVPTQIHSPISTLPLSSYAPVRAIESLLPAKLLPRISPPDQTLEILMHDLHPSSCSTFYYPKNSDSTVSAQQLGLRVSAETGITALFPLSSADHQTDLDAFSFQPCGYSANVTMQTDRYATIHVTPEPDWSYASFETNMEFGSVGDGSKLDVKEVVQRLLTIFNPGKWTMTLFVSGGEEGVETTGEQGLAALHEAKFLNDQYRRTAKVVYDFDDYELLFSTFTRRTAAESAG